MADSWTAELYDIHCGQISIYTATRINQLEKLEAAKAA